MSRHMVVPRVVLADSQPLARYGIRQLLESHHDARVIAETGSVADFMEILASMRHDVMVANFSMLDTHGERGLPLLRQLRTIYPYSSMVLRLDIRDAGLSGPLMQAGVLGLVDKDADTPELRMAVRMAGGGVRYVSRLFRRKRHTRMRDALCAGTGHHMQSPGAAPGRF